MKKLPSSFLVLCALLTITDTYGISLTLKQGETKTGTITVISSYAPLLPYTNYTQKIVGKPTFIQYSSSNMRRISRSIPGLPLTEYSVLIDYSLDISPSAPSGSYTFSVEYTLSIGGSSPRTETINFDITIEDSGVGISDLTPMLIRVYPNPFVDNLTICGTGFLTEPRIVIYSATGTIVFDNEVVEDIFVINMTNCKSGIYMVRIMSKNKVIQTRKILKL